MATLITNGAVTTGSPTMFIEGFLVYPEYS